MKRSVLFFGPLQWFALSWIGLLWNSTDSACTHSFRFDSISNVSVLVASSHLYSHCIYVWMSVPSISFPHFFSTLTIFCGPITACTYFCVDTNHIAISMCLPPSPPYRYPQSTHVEQLQEERFTSYC